MTLVVNVVKGRNLPSADSNGYSDPYCVLQAGQQKHVTKIKKKTLNPLWNESFLFDVRTADKLVVQVWDKDALAKDDFLGQCVVELGGLMLDGSDSWFPLRNRDGSSAGAKGELLLQFSVEGQAQPVRTRSTADAPKHASSSSGPAALPKEAYVTGDKMSSSLLKDIKKRVELFVAGQATSDTPFVGPPDGPAATLSLSGVGLTYVPHTVGAVTQLQGLNLGFNKLKSFPQLTPLVCLEVLHMEGNQMTSLSASVGRLTRLRELHLNGNQLVALPDTIAKLGALEKLSVANNRLTTLPPQIGCLSRLEELNLNGNPLVQGLPPEVGACSALEVMDLSACQLTVLPDDFTLLTRLMELNLASNRLAQLPQAVGRMTRLVRLDLSDNRLSDLPLSAGHLTGLQTLMVQGNPIRNQRLLEKFSIGSDHLVDYLERRMMEYLADHPSVDLQELDALRVKTSAQVQMRSGGVAASAAGGGQRGLVHQGQGNSPQPGSASDMPQSSMSLEQKLGLVRKEGLTLMTELQSKLATMKRSVAATQSLDQALGLAQYLRNMKPGVDQLKTLLPPLAKPAPPLIQKTDDKLTAVKKTVNVALFDLEKTLATAHNILASAQDPRIVVQLVKIAKALVAVVASIA